MQLPRPRFTVFRMMVTVAITAMVMGWAIHARDVLHEEEDFGYGILFFECIGMLMLSMFALPIVLVIYLVRQDDAYAARLRRNDVPGDFHPVAVADSSSQPESS